MAKPSPKPKLKNNYFYGVNIKLLSNHRHGEEAYFSIVQDIYNKDIVKQISGDKAATLSSQFVGEFIFEEKKHKVLYGKVTRFTLLDGEKWYDQTNKKFVKQEIPANVFPNGFSSDYIFIPAAHRFYFQAQAKVSINAVITFLTKATRDVVNSGEDFSINIIQSQDAIDEIINSVSLRDLKIKVSYTNDDIGDKAQQAIDKMLKDSHIGIMESHIKPDQTGSLATNSDLVRGLLEVSKENGSAEASIINSDGKRIKIVTKDYPERVVIKTSQTDDVKNKLFNEVMKNYRSDTGRKG